jgi:hypothetical protein
MKTGRSEIRVVIHPETGEKWYPLVDFCLRLGLDVRHQKTQLPDENLWKNGMPKSWLINDVGALRLLLKAKEPQTITLANQLLNEFVKSTGAVDKIIEGLEVGSTVTTPAKNKHISSIDVRQWLMLKERGMTWAQIGKQAGRTRDIIQTYCTPETAPKLIQITVFNMR